MINRTKKTVRCTQCGALVARPGLVYLELSLSDGKFYETIPSDHTSQGSFPFGRDCARRIVTKPEPK